MTTGRPSFLVPPPLVGFDVYRRPPFADIVAQLYRDFSEQVYDVEAIRLLLEAYVHDREITVAQSKDLEQIVLGGLPLTLVDGGSFPDELYIPRGLVYGITDWIVSNARRRQPEMAQMMALALVGTAAGRKVTTPSGDYTHTYQIATAPSGSGKDGPRQSAFKLMAHAGGDRLMGTESVTSATAIISQLKNNPALLFPIDEVGKVVGNIKSKNASNHEREVETLLLKLWSSADNPSFNHKGFAKIEDNVSICQPSASLIGTSTAETLYGQGALDRTSVVDGFLSRCILFDTGSKVPDHCNPVRTQPPSSIVEPLAAWINFEPAGETGWILDPRPKIATFSPEAERAMQAATVRWDILADRLPSENGASIYRRCLEKARKYALIYAVSEHTPEDEIVVQRHHADWGIAAISWLTDHSLWIVKHRVSASVREQQMAEILEFIRSKKTEGATYRDISRAFRKLPIKTRDDLVIDLALSGDVCGGEIPTSGRTRNTLWAKEFLDATVVSRTTADGGLPSQDTTLAV